MMGVSHCPRFRKQGRIVGMARRPTGRPSKGPRAVVLPQVLLADDLALKALATSLGWYVSETAAKLINIGLQHVDELPDELPLRVPRSESTGFTARIPLTDDQVVREIARERDRSISLVAGSLIHLGLRYRNEIPGQIPVQYNRPEQPLTKAS
ncbi:hypothetical protein [Pseudonocardia sp. ICBG1034]|uniref:hypothetical protein n=1 Tax=Pseudonocardia sp. ICBG1034 TaxID=2844381 RepID=UPI001CCBC8A1|nr:hypothetical protein [Pseudonocardia sp. ICBG1034]